MSSLKTAADIVAALRVDVDMTDTQQAQIFYERALKDEHWPVRTEALPLIVGCDPSRWRDHLDTQGLHPQEETLWHILANDLGIEADARVNVATLVEWARGQSLGLHPSFLRIYEFVRKVLLASAHEPVAEAEETDRHLAHEREIVLGAALSLLAKMPEKCRDANGFVDGAAIVELIQATAARWFTQSAPQMDAAEMARFIDKWLE